MNSTGQTAPRFSGGFDTVSRPFMKALGPLTRTFTNLAIPTFQQITEVFLWGFMAQDMIALWFPRIRQSLVRGSEPYNAKDDPTYTSNLGFGDQLKKLVGGTVKGLNWPFFFEEAGREVTIGPGMLLFPSLLFMGYRHFLGGQMINLPTHELETYSHSFMGHLADKGVGGHTKIGKQDYVAHLRDFAKNHFFADEAMRSDAKVGQALENWANAWAGAVEARLPHEGTGKAPDAKAANRALEAAEKQLQTLIENYKEETFKATGKPLRHLRTTVDIAFREMADEGKTFTPPKAATKGIGEVFGRMNQWRDFAVELFKQQGQESGHTLIDAGRKILDTMASRKFTIAVVTTLLTAAYLVGMTKMLQGSKEYPGNHGRTLDEGNEGTASASSENEPVVAEAIRTPREAAAPTQFTMTRPSQATAYQRPAPRPTPPVTMPPTTFYGVTPTPWFVAPPSAAQSFAPQVAAPWMAPLPAPTFTPYNQSAYFQSTQQNGRMY